MSLAVQPLIRLAVLNSVFANRVLVVEISVNRSSSPFGPRLVGCLTTATGVCATGGIDFQEIAHFGDLLMTKSGMPDHSQSPRVATLGLW